MPFSFVFDNNALYLLLLIIRKNQTYYPSFIRGKVVTPLAEAHCSGFLSNLVRTLASKQVAN